MGMRHGFWGYTCTYVGASAIRGTPEFRQKADMNKITEGKCKTCSTLCTENMVLFRSFTANVSAVLSHPG